VSTSLRFSSPVRDALDDAKQALENLYGDRLERLIVYGSQARGDAGPDSDVDLLIVLDDDDVDPDTEAQRTSRLVVRIAAEHGVALSPLHLSRDHFQRDRPLPRTARREGIVL
jgi:predicted nucleotidyltransferase